MLDLWLTTLSHTLDSIFPFIYCMLCFSYISVDCVSTSDRPLVLMYCTVHYKTAVLLFYSYIPYFCHRLSSIIILLVTYYNRVVRPLPSTIPLLLFNLFQTSQHAYLLTYTQPSYVPRGRPHHSLVFYLQLILYQLFSTFVHREYTALLTYIHAALKNYFTAYPLFNTCSFHHHHL